MPLTFLRDPERLAALYRSGLLDSDVEETFDRITRLVAHALGSSVSLFSLVEMDRQFFKSTFGPIQVRDTNLESSFCKYVVNQEEPLVVDDARKHPLVRDNEAIKGLGVVAYLGVPVYSPDGFAIGSICAIEPEPRRWTDAERELLVDYSALLTSELSIRKSGRHLRALSDAFYFITFTADAQGFATEVRRVGQPEPFVPKREWNWASTVHPDDYDHITERWKRTVETRDPFVAEHRVQRLDGSYYWARTKAVPVYDSQGRFVEFFGTCSNIDAERGSRERLEQQQSIMASFFETSPLQMGVVELMGEGEDVSFVLLNRATEEFLAMVGEHFESGSLKGQGARDDLMKPYLDAYRQTIERGEPVHFTYAHPISDGRLLLSVTVNQIRGTGDRVLCSFVTEDVTEERDAAERLRMSEARLDLALRSAQIGTWDYDTTTGKPDWSTLALDVHGANEFDGRRLSAFAMISPTDRPMVLNRLRNALVKAKSEGDASVSMEYRTSEPEGERWVRSMGRVYARADGSARIAGTLQDITRDKQYERELIKARESALNAQAKAEEASQLKSSILENMSHEVRTPLTAILGFTDLIAAHPEDPDPELIDIIRRSAEQLLDTLNSVLYFAQLEGGIVLRPSSLDIAPTVAHAAQQYANMAHERGLSLTVHSSSVLAWADQDALHKITAQLVSNAVKFTRGGTVDVRMGSSEGRAWLEVEDTGAGMEEAFLARAFEPFRQESVGLNRQYQGSGLGLSIVQRLVHEMGASLDVETEKGQGTRVRVWLPTSSNG